MWPCTLETIYKRNFLPQIFRQIFVNFLGIIRPSSSTYMVRHTENLLFAAISANTLSLPKFEKMEIYFGVKFFVDFLWIFLAAIRFSSWMYMVRHTVYLNFAAISANTLLRPNQCSFFWFSWSVKSRPGTISWSGKCPGSNFFQKFFWLF